MRRGFSAAGTACSSLAASAAGRVFALKNWPLWEATRRTAGWLPPGRQRRLVRSRRENLGGTPKGRASAAREGRRNVQRLDVLRGAKAELVIFTATSSATRFGKQEHSYRAQTQVLSHAMKMHGCVFALIPTNRKPDSASTSQK